MNSRIVTQIFIHINATVWKHGLSKVLSYVVSVYCPETFKSDIWFCNLDHCMDHGTYQHILHLNASIPRPDLLPCNIQVIYYGKFMIFEKVSNLDCQGNSKTLTVLSIKASAQAPTHRHAHIIAPLILTLICVRQMHQWDNNGVQRLMSESWDDREPGVPNSPSTAPWLFITAVLPRSLIGQEGGSQGKNIEEIYGQNWSTNGRGSWMNWERRWKRYTALRKCH